MWYTKKGDNGTSKTLGAANCIPKSDLVFESLGNIDELNSWLGFINASLKGKRTKNLKEEILEIQYDLFTVQAELAGSKKNLPKNRIIWLEKIISNYETHCLMPKGFVVPGAEKETALFDVARTVARRAERSVVRIKEKNSGMASSVILSYLNRLSSYLYVCARYLAASGKKKELQPKYR